MEPGIAVLDQLPDNRRYSGLSLVGEMPGRNEVKQLRPFVGASGWVLKTVWDLLGVNSGQIHVTNCIRCGLPGGAKLPEEKGKFAAECCRPLLIENLNRIGAKVVCAVGAVPWAALSGMTGIDKFRGTVLEPVEGEPWLLTSTIHPAGLLRTEARKIMYDLLYADLKKAYDLAGGQVELWVPDVRDASDSSALINFLDKVLVNGYPMSADVETTDDILGRIDGWTARLLTIGVASTVTDWSEGSTEPQAWSIPWKPAFQEYYSDRSWKELTGLMMRILDNPKQHVIFHNKSFDVPVLQRHLKINIDAIRDDTLLMHHAGYPKLPHKLQQVASQFFAVEPWKDNFKVSDEKFWKFQSKLEVDWDRETADPEEDSEELSKRVWELEQDNFAELLWYNAADAAVTEKLYHILRKDLKEMGLLEVYRRDRKLSDYTLDWTEDGIGIDLEQRAVLDRKYSTELAEMEAKLRELSRLPLLAEVQPKISELVDKVNGLLDDRRQLSRVITLIDKGVRNLKDRHKFIEKKGEELKQLQQDKAPAKKIAKARTTLARAIRDQEDIDLARKYSEEGKDGFDLNKIRDDQKIETDLYRDQLTQARKQLTKETFNPRSGAHVLEVVLRRGMTPTKVTKKKNISVSRDSLWPLRSDEFIDLLFSWRKSQKLHSTYIVNLRNKLGPDRRLHPVWKIYSTPTGRFGTTPAVQNWPKSMRSLMIASPGHKIVGADYAALELRIAALLSDEPEWVDAFLNNKDLHEILAARYFPEFAKLNEDWHNFAGDKNAKDAKFPRRSELRNRGKNITFGDIYLAGAETLYDQVREKRPDIQTREEHDQLRREVAAMQRVLRAATPNRLRWAELQLREADQNAALRTAVWPQSWNGVIEEQGGRERRWPMGNPSPNECANFPIQGMAADIMNAATIRLIDMLREKDLYRNGIWIIMQVHDALYLEVADEYQGSKYLPDLAAKYLEESMYCEIEYQSPVTGRTNTMKFPAEAKVGSCVKEV